MSRKKNKNSLSTFVNTILAIFGEHPFKPMNYKQIAKMMSVRDAAGKDVIHQILVTLCNEGKLIEDRPYRYLLHPDYIREYGPKPQYVIGTVDMTSGEAPEQLAWGLAFPEATKAGALGPRRKSRAPGATRENPGGSTLQAR